MKSYFYISLAIPLILACNSNEDESGDDLSSSTQSVPAYMDLGLSVMWATCNIGASSPEQSGNYYAWAEKTAKSSYEEENSSSYRVYLLDISGNSSYDVAKAKLGGSYRIPYKRTNARVGR